MQKIYSEKNALKVLENVRAILPLSAPPANWSTIDWHWEKICGIPFLIRNIINIQRAGIDSLTIYSNGDNADLHKMLCKEKKIKIELTFETDITEVVKLTKNGSVLILNRNVLYTKQEIESGMRFINQSNLELVGPNDAHSITELLTQITLGEKSSIAQSPDIQGSQINFLSGKNSSNISKPEDFILQQKKLIQGSGLSNDSLMDKTITRFFSHQLTRLFLKTPLSPNMITILSLFIGLASALFFIQGTHTNNIIGAALLLLSAWVDCTDGEVARLKFLESKLGGKLDIICDNLVHFSVFFAIGLGLYQSTGNNFFVLLGTLAVFGSLFSFVLLSNSIINNKEMASANTNYSKKKNMLTDSMANRDFIYFLFFMSLTGRVDIFIFITAIGSNIFAAYLTYTKIKSTLHAS